MYGRQHPSVVKRFLAAITAIGIVYSATRPPSAAAEERAQKMLVAIPPNHDGDIKLYLSGGEILQGVEALNRMNTEAGLVLWLAGNQFFAMDEVIGTFEREHPGVSIGLITLPPGLILSAIQAGGWSYDGKDFPGLPDPLISVI